MNDELPEGKPQGTIVGGRTAASVKGKVLKDLAKNRFLFLAGVASTGIVLTHIAFVFVGTKAHRYFCAGEEMARMSEAGSLIPALLTIGIAVLFFGIALYAFAGANLIGPLPLMSPVLGGSGLIYTLRGPVAGYLIYLQATRPAPTPSGCCCVRRLWGSASWSDGCMRSGGRFEMCGLQSCRLPPKSGYTV